MQLAAIKPLADLLQLKTEPLEAELSVGTTFLKKKLSLESSLESTTKELVEFKDAFPNL